MDKHPRSPTERFRALSLHSRRRSGRRPKPFRLSATDINGRCRWIDKVGKGPSYSSASRNESRPVKGDWADHPPGRNRKTRIRSRTIDVRLESPLALSREKLYAEE